MTAVMMPGAPVADAVFADLEPRIEKLVGDGHTPGLGTILVGDDAAERALHPHEAGEGGGARLHLAARPPAATTRPRPTCSPRSARSTTTRASTRMLVQHPTPPQIDYEAALLEIDPDKDVDGLHPVNMGRLALVDAGPGAVHARGHRGAARALRDPGRRAARSCILGRGVTLGRPLALLLSQKRPTANAAVTVVHTGVPDWPEYTQRADIVVAAAGRARASSSPSTSRPGAVVVGGGVRYEGRKLLPDVDERCEEVAGCDHAAGRRRRPHDDRDAVPQRGRGRRAPSRARA